MTSVMLAFKDGSAIQCCDTICSSYEDVKDPVWNWASFHYRVKPEPKYVPYTFDDAHKILLNIVKYKNMNKNGQCYVTVTGCRQHDVLIGLTWFTYKEAFERFETPQHLPFGKRTDE